MSQPRPIHDDDEDDDESMSTESLPNPIGEECTLGIHERFGYSVHVVKPYFQCMLLQITSIFQKKKAK